MNQNIDLLKANEEGRQTIVLISMMINELITSNKYKRKFNLL